MPQISRRSAVAIIFVAVSVTFFDTCRRRAHRRVALAHPRAASCGATTRRRVRDEQAGFLAAGLQLWLAVLGGSGSVREWRAASGIGALLFTSIHMTLLGALFAVTPRPLYVHAAHQVSMAAALSDQHLGGEIMLLWRCLVPRGGWR